MYVEQLYTTCLAEAAYYIESNGEAAIVDPLRDTDAYVDLARQRGATIKYIFETHFHADFVSGHQDLAKRTGAQIVFGPNAKADFAFTLAADGQDFPLGKLTIRTLHTPGHTMESTTWLLLDEQGKPNAIFTGDTVFINDVGRPDLAVKTDLTKEDLAAHLFESIQNKILTLPDEVVIYPGHGAGSQCGKNLGEERWDTLGHQKAVNYALQITSKQAFVEAVTDGLLPPPAYFPQNAKMNKGEVKDLEDLLRENARGLAPQAFAAAMDDPELTVLDAREPEVFQQAFVPGALNVGLSGQYAVWVGTLVPFNAPLLVVADPGKEEEALVRLARVGYDNVRGYLKGGMPAWQAANLAVDRIDNVEDARVCQAMDDPNEVVLDVRLATEHAAGRIPGATNAPLAQLPELLNHLNVDRTYLVHCAGGYRSMIAASLLKANGFGKVFNIRGGFNALQACGVVPTEVGSTATV